jgi:hypothetical protein
MDRDYEPEQPGASGELTTSHNAGISVAEQTRATYRSLEPIAVAYEFGDLGPGVDVRPS